MKKLSYSIKIQKQPQQVYDNMLGLKSKKTYNEWTAAFNPTSTYEGSWNKGDKIKFIGVDENGKTGGMLARIAENKPASFVSIEHYGMLQDGKEITSGEKIDKWAGAHENYRFEPTDKGTLLSVEVDTEEEYIDYFEKTWPEALEKLKGICEEK